MKVRLLALLAVAAAVLALSAPARAHHGTAVYDMDKTITAKATVSAFVWANPHCILSFDTKDDKGTVIHWSAEMHNPLWLSRAGWNRNTLKTGDQIVVTFHPAKNGTGNGLLREGDGKIVLNGSELPLDNGTGTTSTPSN